MNPRQLSEAENCGLMRRDSGVTGVCYNPEDDKHSDLGLGRGKVMARNQIHTTKKKVEVGGEVVGRVS